MPFQIFQHACLTHANCQLDQMDYMVEQTQNHISMLGLESPGISGDQRHIYCMKYPFMDYDILTNKPEGI